MEMQEKVVNVISNEDAVNIVHEFEQIIKKKKTNVIWLA